MTAALNPEGWLPPASKTPAAETRTGKQVSIDWFEASVKELGTIELFALVSKHLGGAARIRIRAQPVVPPSGS